MGFAEFVTASGPRAVEGAEIRAIPYNKDAIGILAATRDRNLPKGIIGGEAAVSQAKGTRFEELQGCIDRAAATAELSLVEFRPQVVLIENKAHTN
jgi:hypothetical protein